MALTSWLLVAGWTITILIVVHDLVEWQFRAKDHIGRMRRGPVVMVVGLFLTGLALWSVLQRYL